MFRMLVLQALHNLSDEQVEYQVRDRLSFARFLRLAISSGAPGSGNCHHASDEQMFGAG